MINPRSEVGSKMFYALWQLHTGPGDLDCAAWALEEALAIDPSNEEAAILLKEIIARIDQAFDSRDIMPILCHMALNRESPSPYVRAKEAERAKR